MPSKQNPDIAAHFYFLRLPTELRLEIYKWLLPQNRPIDVSSPRFGLHELKRADNQDLSTSPEIGEDITGRRCTTSIKHIPHYCPQDWTSQNYKSNHNNAIFLVCKQISMEALDVLYGGNIFKLCLDGYDEQFLMQNFANTNWSRITKMLISVKASRPESMRTDIDEGFWAFMLPRLIRLSIVVDAPLFYRDGNAPNVLPWMRQEHRTLHIPNIQIFGKYISSRTVVEVDDDGCSEIQELIKKCIPGVLRKVDCGIIESLVLKVRLTTKFHHSCRFFPSTTSPRSFGF